MPTTRAPRNRQTIIDEGDLRKYRTELPNLIDDLGLSPAAYRVYGHYKRRAGANGGECTEGLRSISQHCKLSINTVRKGRDELLKQGLITVRETIDKTGKHDFVSIVDIWPQNFRKYAKEGVSDFDTRGVSNESQGVSPADTGGVSPRDTEERTIDQEVTNKEISPHSRMMDFLQMRYGPIANGAKEGRAIKWLLEHGYDPVQCEACFDFLAAQDWRTAQVSWVTVQTNIGSFLNGGNGNGNGHKPTASGRRIDQLKANAEYLRSLGGGNHN